MFTVRLFGRPVIEGEAGPFNGRAVQRRLALPFCLRLPGQKTHARDLTRAADPPLILGK